MSANTTLAAERGLPRRSGVAFIVLLGIISLFADMTYEGTRSISGPYLGAHAVTATTIGVCSGLASSSVMPSGSARGISPLRSFDPCSGNCVDDAPGGALSVLYRLPRPPTQ